MKIQIVKSNNILNWYHNLKFPIKCDIYQINDKYYTINEGGNKGKAIYISDCINDEEYQLELFSKEETKKFDKGKPDFSLIPQAALKEVAKVMTYGAEKYGRYNNSNGTDHCRYIAAGLRHNNQFLMFEDFDTESKLHHLAHVAANALMALDNILTNKGTDNRNQVYQK